MRQLRWLQRRCTDHRRMPATDWPPPDSPTSPSRQPTQVADGMYSAIIRATKPITTRTAWLGAGEVIVWPLASPSCSRRTRPSTPRRSGVISGAGTSVPSYPAPGDTLRTCGDLWFVPLRVPVARRIHGELRTTARISLTVEKTSLLTVGYRPCLARRHSNPPGRA